MNIISIERFNDRLIVKTDDNDFPDFNFPADRFANVSDLLAEINAHVSRVNTIKDFVDNRVGALESDYGSDIPERESVSEVVSD